VLLQRLEESSKTVSTLAGEFSQRNRLRLFKQELRSKGRFFFRRPRQIRWEYTTPDPSTLILDGQRATLTMPGSTPQVFDLERDATMRAIFDQLLLWLGPGSLGQARADYQLSVAGTAEQPVLQLVPKPGGPIARAFLRVALRLDGKSLLIRAIELTERNGDDKEITFTRLDRNPALPPDAFK
jgi:outer membrane lipoprotein carrier protein